MLTTSVAIGAKRWAGAVALAGPGIDSSIPAATTGNPMAPTRSAARPRTKRGRTGQNCTVHDDGTDIARQTSAHIRARFDTVGAP